jgi:ubiquinone/menaquinone biosynthesis C-methylase UbiE
MSEELDRIAQTYRGYEDSQAADRWSLANPGNRAALHERQKTVQELLAEHGWLPLGSRRVLEVGCGTGAELARLMDYGATPENLVGVDLLADRVATAKHSFPDLDLRIANAERLDFDDAAFDLVLAITLFSSIMSKAMSRNVATEIDRVMKPGGALLWYDFRCDNPRNRNVRGISEAEVHELFPRLNGTLRRITLLPPLSRRLGPLTPILYRAFSAVPGLRTHLVGLLDKASR